VLNPANTDTRNRLPVASLTNPEPVKTDKFHDQTTLTASVPSVPPTTDTVAAPLLHVVEWDLPFALLLQASPPEDDVWADVYMVRAGRREADIAALSFQDGESHGKPLPLKAYIEGGQTLPSSSFAIGEDEESTFCIAAYLPPITNTTEGSQDNG
jgi:hypothetical protein